jgi:hypothetical protein
LNLTPLCASAALNTWTLKVPVPRDKIAKIGIAVTDLAGNLATRIIRYLPDDLYLDNLDPQYSEIQGDWTSTSNAAWGTDARIALLASNDTAEASWSLPVSASGLYNFAIQVPAITNGATNLVFKLQAGQSNVCSVSLTNGLPHNQWKFLCSAFLDQTVSNSLEMIVAGTNQPGTFAVVDVISMVPIVSDPALPPQDRLAISSIGDGRLLQFAGEAGSVCAIQRSTNLVSGWITLDTLAVPLTGILEYQDRYPPATEAFYRVSRP